jgi:hypothetical protein
MNFKNARLSMNASSPTLRSGRRGQDRAPTFRCYAAKRRSDNSVAEVWFTSGNLFFADAFNLRPGLKPGGEGRRFSGGLSPRSRLFGRLVELKAAGEMVQLLRKQGR